MALALAYKSNYNPAAVAITGGMIKLDDGAAVAPSYSFGSMPSTGMYTNGITALQFAVSGANVLTLDSGNVYLNNKVLSFGTGAEPAMVRDAANTLAQRNGVNAQSFRVYNTFTDASNYERAVFDWTTNTNYLTIGTAQAGTGNVRAIMFSIGGASRWQMNSSAQLLPIADNNNDIGSSANNVRALYVKGIVALTKAGAFVAADVPSGQFAVGRDTVGATTKLLYNNAGTLMSVALA